jgi:LacI family transcriptional regulator
MKQAKQVGIKQIAQELGISIGTVDRALNNRPGINPITRAKVLSMAKTLGYQPNLAARYLSSKKQFYLSVQLPREISAFFDLLREGILEASKPFEPAVKISFRDLPTIGVGEVEAFEEALRDKAHGVIIAPGHPENLKGLIRKASQRKVPVVCVATDAPNTDRLATVSVDPFTNGSVVGELMGRFLQGRGEVLVITGLLSASDHAGKLNGFRETLKVMYPRMRILGAVEAHDDPREAKLKSRQFLQENPAIAGIYVSTANSIPVLEAVDELGLSGKVAIITTDLFPDLAAQIRSGKVAATIHQRPFEQGQIAFKTLYRFLVEGYFPSPNIRLAPEIVIKSNVDIFLERMPLAEIALDVGTR